MVNEKNGNPVDLPLVYVTTAPSPALSTNERYDQTRQSQEEWTCSKCTLLNPGRKLYCIACFQRHPDLIPSVVSSDFNNNQYHNEGENNNYYCEDDNDDDDDHIVAYDRQQTTMTTNNDNNHDIIVVEESMNIMDTSSIPLSENNYDTILEAQGEEDPFHKKLRRRVRRKRRMVACGAAGTVAGAVLFSPVLLGIIAGGTVGATGARIISKRKERSKDERLVKERAMMAASQSPQSPPSSSSPAAMNGIERSK
jgi:hypothetical protein